MDDARRKDTVPFLYCGVSCKDPFPFLWDDKGVSGINGGVVCEFAHFVLNRTVEVLCDFGYGPCIPSYSLGTGLGSWAFGILSLLVLSVRRHFTITY